MFQSVLKNAWNKCTFESTRKFVFHPPGETVIKKIVGIRHRALAVETKKGLLWFWIGIHSEYEELIK